MAFKESLLEQVEREVMACIGCNDCMLACPLAEVQLVTIAELNAAVHQPMISNPNVIAFVTACTQCRQCVPVCPADLSRADMVLWNKMKVEDVAPNREVGLQVGAEVWPSGWRVNELAGRLGTFPLFAGVAAADLRRLTFSITLRRLEPGEVLCREGEFHERLMVILEGAVEQQMTAGARVLVMGPGSFHGEMAVMENQAESFTIVALEPSLVVEIPKAACYRLMEGSAAFQTSMTELYRRHALWTHAVKSPVLAALPEEAVRQLLAGATLQTLAAGEKLYQEGEEPAAFYLVRAGFLRASRHFGEAGERVLIYFREGDSFGALPLLVGGRHTISVQASSRAEVIVITAAALQAVLAHFPAARNALMAQAMQAEKQLQGSPLGQAPRPAENSTQISLSWTALLDKGVVQSHELLVIDQNRCTNCNNCVDACGRRHGLSRLERRGLQIENLLFPTACRHCHDPVCLLCSVNGIVRLPNGEITIIEDNCIGCGACAQRCPYGNIQIHEVKEEVQPNLLFDLWDLLRGGVAQQRAVEQLNPKKAYKAVKCDLCAGYNDYACVTACPVSAAFRIDPVKAFGRDDLLIGLEMKRKT